jgi:hypothetical protein
MSDRVPLDDVLAVQDLLGRYCWFLDEGRGEDWAALYTEDGVFEGTRPQPVIGRTALATVPPELRERGQGKLRHQYGNLYLERGADDNTLVARFYNQLSHWSGSGGQLFMLAVSTAILVRAGPDAAWRIRRNTIVPLR